MEKILKRQGNIVMKKSGKVYWVFMLPFMSYLEKFWVRKNAEVYFRELIREHS